MNHNHLNSAQASFTNQIEALVALRDSLDNTFNEACELLLACKGKVVVSGMGKSGHIGKKIAATLASTGTPSFFMHPAEANHGDFGMLSKDDVVIGISNSGETSELVSLLPSIKRLKIPIIAITNNSNSSLAKSSHTCLTLKVKKEACSLGLAPTTSTTATIVLGDALAIALLEAKGFTADDFAFSHPGGALGKRLLLTVENIMVNASDVPLVEQTASVKEALLEMSSKTIGLTGVVDAQNCLVGVFSDGDLRRTLNKQVNIDSTIVKQVMTANGITVKQELLAIDALNVMQEKRINALIVVDDKNHPIGAINMYMLLNAGVV